MDEKSICMKEKKELPYTDHFIATEDWVKKTLRKGLKKRSREFYIVTSVNRLNNGEYFIKLEKEFKL